MRKIWLKVNKKTNLLAGYLAIVIRKSEAAREQSGRQIDVLVKIGTRRYVGYGSPSL